MLVGGFGSYVRLVNVISPNRIEGGNVAGHPGHKAGQQGRQPQSQNAGREVVEQHVRYGEVVIQLHLALVVALWRAGFRINFRGDESLTLRNDHGGGLSTGYSARTLVRQRYCNQARKDHQHRKEHFWEGRNQRSPSRRAHGIGGHGPLDDQKIRTPITKRKDKPKSHGQPKPLHP